MGTGGIKINTENFSKLVESKLGDSKPLTEQGQYGKLGGDSIPTQQNQPQYGGYNTTPQQTQNVTGNDRISNIASLMATLQNKMVPVKVINNPASNLNGMSWNDYLTKYKITKQELDQATALLSKFGKAPGAQSPSTATQNQSGPPTPQLSGSYPTRTNTSATNKPVFGATKKK